MSFRPADLPSETRPGGPGGRELMPARTWLSDGESFLDVAFPATYVAFYDIDIVP